jgi:hypothetical protein
VNKSRITTQHGSRSILEELNRAIPAKKKEHVVESRGHHIISSAIHFLQVLTENYSEEESEIIVKRFLSSIKNGDPDRFIRQVRKLRESKVDE